MGADGLVVLCVGRLAPEKNLEALAQAFRAIQHVHTAAKLVLVGDGPAARALQLLCPDAIFAGMRSGDDLAAHYASADLFLFPSLTETFGNVTPEAMASGLPVVAFDYAAASQLIVPGETGRLAPFGDVDAFVRHAVALAGDREAARAMGRRARRLAETLGWERIVDQIESRFGAVIEAANQPSHPASRAPLLAR